jgi:hypothetical protein
MKKLLVLIAAAIFVAGSVMPVMAQDKAEWSFYGSARMWTAYLWRDFKVPTGSSAVLGSPGIEGFDDNELIWDLQSNSRFGANVSFGNVGGRIEYGHTGDPGGNVTNRLMYGTWNFGPGTLLFGQDYTPLFFPISDQCGLVGGDCGLIFWGTVYSGRVPQAKLTMGGLKVGLMKPDMVQKLPGNTVLEVINQPGTTVVPVGALAPGGPLFAPGVLLSDATDPTTGIRLREIARQGFTFVETDAKLPEIEATYTFNVGPAAILVGGGYKTYDVRGIVNGIERTYSVDAWLLNAAARTNWGPFYVNASLAIGQNIGDYGFTADIPAAGKSAAYIAQSDSIEDADNILAALVLGFRMSDTIKFEAGLGYVNGERVIRPGVEDEYTTMAYYLQMAWSPVKNVFIVPEVGYADYGDRERTGAADLDLGDAKYVGIKWQINF